MSKLAILQMSDTPQIESSALMLRSAGYEVMVPSLNLCRELQAMGLEVVVPIESAMSYGCDALDPTIGRATAADVARADLWADIKINNFARVWRKWPHLTKRSVFWRVNGGIPEHCINSRGDHGDERNPPAPAVTANLWYSSAACASRDRNYTFWPPYPRMKDYDPARRDTDPPPAGPPVCFCHSVRGWGFGAIVGECLEMGIKIYGVNSPAGKVPHSEVPNILANSLCMVHIKSSDCPGWALYEGHLSGNLVILPEWLVAMGGMYDLYKNGETCITYGVPCNETGRGDVQFAKCVEEIRAALHFARTDPAGAKRIGLAGRARLLELMWNVDRDGPAFRDYLARVIQ